MKRALSFVLALLIVVPMLVLPSSAAEAAWMWPVLGTTAANISQYYGTNHDGLDIAAGAGTTVLASKSGTVERAYTGCRNFSGYGKTACTSIGCTPNAGTYAGYCNGGYGNGVVINHGDGTYSHYAHLSSIAVAYGQRVSQGQVIGTTGSSGMSYGPHLHFALARSVSGSGNRFNNNPGSIAYLGASTAVPPDAKPSVVVDTTMSQYRVESTNAVLSGRINNPGGGTISTVGLYLYGKDGIAMGQHVENCDSAWANRTSVPMWFDLNKEAKLFLKPGVQYQYALYAYVDGKLYVSSKASFQTTGYTLGDVDLNGTINAADALLTLQGATKKVTLNSTQTSAASVDKISGVGAGDALAILQYATKKITVFQMQA